MRPGTELRVGFDHSSADEAVSTFSVDTTSLPEGNVGYRDQLEVRQTVRADSRTSAGDAASVPGGGFGGEEVESEAFGEVLRDELTADAIPR